MSALAKKVDAGETVADIIDAFDQLFVIAHRSAILDGDMQTRGVQFCPPVVEGTGAGFQIVSPAPLLLDRDAAGEPRVSMVAEVLRRIDHQAERVDRLAALGLLPKDGRWHRLLREKLFWGTGRTLHLWTGHLVRPRPGVSLYLTTAFNRRCGATVRPELFERPEWVPLVLTLTVRETPRPPLFLKGDVACLLPVSPRMTIVKRTLAEAPEVGDQVNTFFDKSYFGKSRNSGRYRELVRGEPMKGDAEATCEIIHVGPDIHEVTPLAPVASAKGPTRASAHSKTQGVVLRNLCAISGTWDGFLGACRRGKLTSEIAAFHRQWGEQYGEEHLANLAALSSYMFGPSQGRREVLIRPWVFVRTPPGWSTVIDGVQAPGLEGLRGIMSTDVHHSVPLVFRLNEVGDYSLRAGAPIGNLIPIPRHLLRTTFALKRLDKLDDETLQAASL